MIGVAGGGGGEVKILPPPFRPLRGPYRADRGRFAVGRPERQVRAVNPPRRPPEPPPEGGPPAGPPKVRSPASPGARGTWPSGVGTPRTTPGTWAGRRGGRRRGENPTPPFPTPPGAIGGRSGGVRGWPPPSARRGPWTPPGDPRRPPPRKEGRAPKGPSRHSPGARGTWPSGEAIPGGPPSGVATGRPPRPLHPSDLALGSGGPSGGSVPGGPPYQQGPRLAHPAHLALGARDPPGTKIPQAWPAADPPPRLFHVPHLALGWRGPWGARPRGTPRSQGRFTPLTWRSDHVTPRGGYPRKNPPGKATGRPAQGPFTPPTWRSDDGTPWGRRAGG